MDLLFTNQWTSESVPPDVGYSRQQKLDHQRMLLTERNRQRRMNSGMVMANRSAVRPVSSRGTRPSSRLSTTSEQRPVSAVVQQDVPSPHKASSESSLEEVFLDSPSTKNKQSHCNVVFVDSPSKRSTSSSSSGGSYSTRLLNGGDGPSEFISHEKKPALQLRLEAIGVASTVDYSVSSDEEEHKGLSVAPVIGWQGSGATAPQLEEGVKEEQPPAAELATATLRQHDEAAMSQVKEPEEDEPRQPMTVPAPSTQQLPSSPMNVPLQSAEIDNLEEFVQSPAPEGVIVQCRITRQKGLFPVYYLHMEDKSGSKKFLLGARKRKKATSSNYIISMDATDLSRSTENCVGKLRSNFVGTSFTIYDNGLNPGRGVATPSGSNLREELAVVSYETNVLGFKGPRKMNVVVPALTKSHQRIAVKPRTDSQTLMERWKNGLMDDLLELHNKQPQWSTDSQAYVLNFHGRVTQASVKNFQLVHESDQDYVVLQFGKVTSEVFTMDYCFPLSALQAFGIALSSFDSKLACE